MIVTANTYFGGKPVDWWILAVMAPLAKRRGVQLRPPVDDLPPIPAHVNEGRWKVKCPDPRCRGYEEVWEEGLFVCGSCFNGAVGHQLLLTSFPAERAEIETILNRRPLSARNWECHESIVSLIQDNALHTDELIPAGQG